MMLVMMMIMTFLKVKGFIFISINILAFLVYFQVNFHLYNIHSPEFKFFERTMISILSINAISDQSRPLTTQSQEKRERLPVEEQQSFK